MALIQNLISRQQFCVDVSLNDLASFDGELADKIRRSPTEIIPLFEEAAKEVADEVHCYSCAIVIVCDADNFLTFNFYG